MKHPINNCRDTQSAELPIPFGVYEVKVSIDGNSYPAIANNGTKPTVRSAEPVLEVHVPGEKLPQLYGKEVKVEFLRFIREEKKFSSLEELKEQIKFDLNNLKSIWREKIGSAAEL